MGAVLLKNRTFVEAPSAQNVYVGAQRSWVWRNIYQYARGNFGMQQWRRRVNFLAMRLCCFFLPARWICTFPAPGSSQASKLFNYFQLLAILLLLGPFFFTGMTGLYCLVAIFICHVVDVPHHLWDRAWRTWRDSKFCSSLILRHGASWEEQSCRPLQGMIPRNLGGSKLWRYSIPRRIRSQFFSI